MVSAACETAPDDLVAGTVAPPPPLPLGTLGSGVRLRCVAESPMSGSLPHILIAAGEPVDQEDQSGVDQGAGQHHAHGAGEAELALGERGDEQLLRHDQRGVVRPAARFSAAM